MSWLKHTIIPNLFNFITWRCCFQTFAMLFIILKWSLILCSIKIDDYALTILSVILPSSFKSITIKIIMNSISVSLILSHLTEKKLAVQIITNDFSISENLYLGFFIRLYFILRLLVFFMGQWNSWLLRPHYSIIISGFN